MAARLALLVLLALAACQPPARAPGGEASAPALSGPGLTGTVRLAVAEGVLGVAREEAEQFGRRYPKARVLPEGTTAREALVRLQSGQADAALLDRDLTEAERVALRAAGLELQETLVGSSAVVAVVHPASTVRSISLDDLRRAAGGTGPFPLALASRNVGSAGAAAAGLGLADVRPAAVLPREVDVIAYVASHVDAVGLVSMGVPLGRTRAVSLRGEGGLSAATPRSVFNGEYPLVQPLVLLTPGHATEPERRALLAGFARFVSGAQGQEVVLRSALAPATLPQREVVLQ